MTEDPYATSKANLRDNVKTLITMFGGATAVLLAGTPFTGFATIRQTNRWFWGAAVALVIALILLLGAVQLLLYILRPDPSSLGMLDEADPNREIKAVQEKFKSAHRDLLPVDENGSPVAVTQMVAEMHATLEDYTRSVNNARDAFDLSFADIHKQRFDRIKADLDTVVFWISFIRLHRRVQIGVWQVMGIGVAALIAIAAFVIASSWAAHPDTPPSPSIYVVTPSSAEPPQAATPAPACLGLKPVLFATGQPRLTKEAVALVGIARKCLLKQPTTGILIFANTDTVGGEKVNESLAYRRADNVAKLLRTSGDISSSRIFVTPLAKKDLPAFTGQGTESESNRSVQMILVPLTVRHP